jgi:hypothetical protein
MTPTITVNGHPLAEFIEEETNLEITKHRQLEARKETLIIRAANQYHPRGIRNHSGSRTSRGRVIMAGGMMVANA